MYAQWKNLLNYEKVSAWVLNILAYYGILLYQIK